MKRFTLFFVALIFAFCTTVMAAEPVAAPAAAPVEKATTVKAEKAKKVKKAKKAKKAKKEKKENKEEAPAAQ